MALTAAFLTSKTTKLKVGRVTRRENLIKHELFFHIFPQVDIFSRLSSHSKKKHTHTQNQATQAETLAYVNNINNVLRLFGNFLNMFPYQFCGHFIHSKKS